MKNAFMGKPEIALMEELAEVIQVIAKKERFSGDDWDDIPPGLLETRWNRLCEEMKDVQTQWERLCNEYYNARLAKLYVPGPGEKELPAKKKNEDIFG